MRLMQICISLVLHFSHTLKQLCYTMAPVKCFIEKILKLIKPTKKLIKLKFDLKRSEKEKFLNFNLKSRYLSVNCCDQ